MAEAPQTYANHKRIDPWYHYVAFGLAGLAFLLAVWHPLQSPWRALIATALLVLLLRVRIYALRVQDRVIRLEETLRMQALLPEPLRSRIGELRPGQFVALRFAADAELADRVEEALAGKLGGDAIKKRIQVWRPDTFRV